MARAEGERGAVKVGPFETGRVYLGDCRNLMRELPDESVPMIFTDPPYGHNNNDGDLIANREKALGESKRGEPRPMLQDGAAESWAVFTGMLTEAGRVLRRDCCCCCCCCCCGGGGPDPQFARWSLELDKRPFTFFHAVVWDKMGLGMGWRYRRNYELVLVAHRHGGKLKWEWEGSGVETGNVVRLGKILPASSQHPTAKPPELVEHFLRLHTVPGDLVLDPFAGGGTTGVACKRMGREFLGFELDPVWFEYANRRIGVTASEVGTSLWAQPSP